MNRSTMPLKMIQNAIYGERPERDKRCLVRWMRPTPRRLGPFWDIAYFAGPVWRIARTDKTLPDDWVTHFIAVDKIDPDGPSDHQP